MHFTNSVLSAGLVMAAGAQAALTSGFMDARLHDSQGGLASCVSGYVPLTVTSPMNIKLNMPVPQNQFQVTQSYVSQFSAGASMKVMGGTQSVSGNFSIYSTLCIPKASSNSTSSGNSSKAIQLLTHGVGADSTYWDFSPASSYVDVAAMNGAATFSYDRLGVGKSSKPDPIRVVQSPMEIVIAHELTQRLKRGGFGDTTYTKVVGVGHSFGSIITQGVTVQYPTDFAGAVLTGFTTNSTGSNLFITALNLQIASQNNPLRFSGLSNGYLVAQNVISNQFAFFHYPGFDASALYQAELTKGITTIGELATQSVPTKPAPQFTGPVDIVTGEFDLAFCAGNCRVPSDLAVATLKKLYPNAAKGSQTYLVPNSGHGINFQNSAPQAFQQIQKFATSNNL